MIRIKSVKFYNHNIFKNKCFDFTIDGKPVDNVIFAGENGSGKTKLLEEIYHMTHSTYFRYTGGRDENKIKEMIIDLSEEKCINDRGEILEVDTGILEVYQDSYDNLNYKITFMLNNNIITALTNINVENYSRGNGFYLNGLYSSVDVNYSPRDTIRGITNKTLDNNDSIIPTDMAYEIIQLLVDIAMQDSFDTDKWIGENKGKAYPEKLYHARLSRFTKAFKTIFGNKLTYKTILNNTIPIFSKDGKDIEISQLNSGEKQIIFRGIFLLKDKKSIKGTPVFIDEPEISMHPKWEENIFKYYRTLFITNNKQTSQMFISTHSEAVLSSALNLQSSVVIKNSDKKTEKYYKGSSGNILPVITTSEIKYAIFDIYSIDFHCLLYGFIQENFVKDSKGKIKENPTIKQTDEWLAKEKVTMKQYYKQITPDNIKKYKTLQTYIRNCIDHPDKRITYTNTELKKSINEMIKIINKYK